MSDPFNDIEILQAFAEERLSSFIAFAFQWYEDQKEADADFKNDLEKDSNDNDAGEKEWWSN